MKIIPEGKTALISAIPLKPTKAKDTEMIDYAKSLMTEPVEFKDVVDAVEQHYIFTKNEHYTSDQLKTIIQKAKIAVEPQIVVAEV